MRSSANEPAKPNDGRFIGGDAKPQGRCEARKTDELLARRRWKSYNSRASSARDGRWFVRHPLEPILEHRPVRRVDGSVFHQRVGGVRIDMHCHSTFSDERIKYLPGMVWNPLLEPAQIYDLAKRRGMDFVTITDHDTIDGCKALLDERGPLADFIVAEEVSVRFPEDGTIIHVNVYDIDERQHAELQRVRDNLYDFVAAVRGFDKLYVLNHLTWTAQHRVLATWQIEKMLEHFDVFEGLNGTRSYAHNAYAWAVTRGRGKTLVGGSDSHTHRVGTTYTLSAGATPAELLASIRAGVAEPCGAFGTAEKLREDVWLVLSKNAERRIAAAGSAWERGLCRAARRFCQYTYPLACLGYDTRQNLMIRKFLRAMPA
ncbi:MAG: PHP domain-containing protein [Planctomycetota bacterium]|nr:MAG: PHP domain-containing protein [Planctomycetota bacterium]